MGTEKTSLKNKIKRRLPVLVVISVVFIALGTATLSNFVKFNNLKGKLEQAQVENQQLTQDVQKLQTEINRLETERAAVEEIARGRMGMIKKDEVIFKIK